jgi:hypothetical protein
MLKGTTTMRTTTIRPALAATVAALALTLTACGGGEKTTDAKNPAPAGEKVRDTPAPSGEMKLGESATGKVDEAPGAVTYEILPEKVDLSTEAEALAAVAPEYKSKVKGMVLATAHVKYTHKNGPALTDGSDVDDPTTIWADGQRGAPLAFAPEDAKGCEDPYDVDAWKQGDSHTFCETYVVPANAKTVEVHWSEDEAEGEPFIWKFPKSA